MSDEAGVKGTAYAVIPEWILDAEISPRAVRLFAVLSRYVGANESAWPSRKTLADRCRCSVDTIDRALGELEAIGAIAIETRQREDGSWASSLYSIWPRLPEGADAAGQPQPCGEVAATVRLGVAAPVRHHEVTPVRKNPKERTTRSATTHAATFAIFWDAYPRRDGKKLGKAITEDRWRRLTPEEVGRALIAVRHYAQACELDLTRAKDPERWLRGRCWEDWQTPAEPDTRLTPAQRAAAERTARLDAMMASKFPDQEGAMT